MRDEGDSPTSKDRVVQQRRMASEHHMKETSAKLLTICCFTARQREIDDEKKYSPINNKPRCEMTARGEYVGVRERGDATTTNGE